MVTWPGSIRNLRRRSNSELPSSKRVMPKRSSSTESHSTVNRSAIHGTKTASTCPESADITASIRSSGTIGDESGTGVSLNGPLFLSPIVTCRCWSFMRFHVPLDDSVPQKWWMKVGNPYDCKAGRLNAKAPFWACRSVGRSLPWHGRGPEFKSRHVHHFSGQVRILDLNYQSYDWSSHFPSCTRLVPVTSLVGFKSDLQAFTLVEFNVHHLKWNVEFVFSKSFIKNDFLVNHRPV